MKNVGITDFAKRQTEVGKDTTIGGFTGPAATLLDIIGSYPEAEMKPGFAKFVRIVEIHTEDLHWFLSTFREAKTIDVRMEERNKGEVPVPVHYTVAPKVAPSAARVILYSKEQLEKEGFAAGLAAYHEWGIVSINCGPEDEPIPPYTMLRNWYATRHPEAQEAVGGSPHYTDMTDDEFIQRLFHSMIHWAKLAKAVEELPEL